ncbi:hypothetical protein JCGZ_01263 [Jatropha curcas]|uniref:Protein kinase domain-containing protein n=1 Tax=Jatropha curcas TaxID=180498 RepID=A0A067LC37_JATCU|nr:hypothetical protein JCGZ_01263 [Jatropha curcas]
MMRQIVNRVSSHRPESESIPVEDEIDDEIGHNFNWKAITLEQYFLVANFIFKFPSVVFGQLSSSEHPVYGLLNIVLSYIAFIISIIFLVRERRQGRVALRWRCLPRTSADLEFICGIAECIITSIAYFSYLSRHVDDPIRINVWPTVFAFVGLYCNFSATANLSHRRPSVLPLTRRPIPHTQSIPPPSLSNESIQPPPLSNDSIPSPQNTESTPLLSQPIPQTTFTLAKLNAATNNFSPDNEIGAGSFGVVYRGKLDDGREVAIKRGNTGANSSWFQEDENGYSSRFQEDENGFKSKLAVLSRLCHENLVGLVGYCVDSGERLLVYEYMNNSSLSFHLHEKNSSEFNFWKMRIKIALDAARGIEYLHKCADPPIIHGDIRSSNILLDLNWKARVSDFGLSLMDRDSQSYYGFIGYDSNVLPTDTDVYSFGVVLLELLTGRTAKFQDDYESEKVRELVYFINNIIKSREVIARRIARPVLDDTDALNNEVLNEVLDQVLDPRVARPVLDDKDAVELVFKTALRCVNSKGIDTPTMTNIVANLEQALSYCYSMPRFAKIIDRRPQI